MAIEDNRFLLALAKCYHVIDLVLSLKVPMIVERITKMSLAKKKAGNNQKKETKKIGKIG